MRRNARFIRHSHVCSGIQSRLPVRLLIPEPSGGQWRRRQPVAVAASHPITQKETLDNDEALFRMNRRDLRSRFSKIGTGRNNFAGATALRGDASSSAKNQRTQCARTGATSG
ncbi:hypothetical protein MTO96_033032 [Rhipicephalus appendiculatus]